MISYYSARPSGVVYVSFELFLSLAKLLGKSWSAWAHTELRRANALNRHGGVLTEISTCGAKSARCQHYTQLVSEITIDKAEHGISIFSTSREVPVPDDAASSLAAKACLQFSTCRNNFSTLAQSKLLFLHIYNYECLEDFSSTSHCSTSMGNRGLVLPTTF